MKARTELYPAQAPDRSPGSVSHRTKFFVAGFLCVHVPIVAFVAYAAIESGSLPMTGTLLALFVATGAGTAILLWAMYRLFAPVMVMREALRGADGKLALQVRVARAEGELDARRAMQRSLQESEERFRALYDETPSMYFTVDPAGTVLSVNEFGATQLGYQPAELVGQSVLGVFVEADRAAALEHVADCLAHLGKVFQWELRKNTKQGRQMWVKETARAVRGPDGIPLVLIVCQDINERKQAELALRTSEARLRAIIRNQPECIKLLDADGTLLEMNPAGLAMIEADDMAAVAGHCVYPLVVPEHREAFRAMIGRVGGGERATMEFEIVGLRGTRRWLEMHAVPLPDEAGGKSRVLGLTRDVTARKQADAALRESEARYRTVSESMLEGILILQKGRFVHANPAALRLLGRTPEELIGTEFAPLVHPEHRALVVERHRRRSAGEKLEPRYDIQVLNRSGEAIWVQLSNEAIEWLQQPAVLTIISDISERKRSERELLRFRAALDLSTDAIYLVDCNSLAILDCNDGACRALGYRREELVGGGVERIFADRPREQIRAAYAALVNGDVHEANFQALHRRKNGSVFPVEINRRIHRTATGPILVGVARDITDQVRAERMLQELNQTLERRVAERTSELQALAREREAFSYSIAHDLRSPLGVISGFCHILGKDEEMRLSPEGRRMLQVIEDNIAHLVTLVDALLALAQVSRVTLERKPIDLRQIAAAAAEALSLRYPRARIALGALPPVNGDPTLVAQVLTNLLENAFKYSSREAAPQVSVGWKPEARACYVHDNGVGFDMRHADNLFSAFERLHADPDFSGSGIGLAIVKRVVERHGGRVWADAAPGDGATFYFSLDAPSAG